MKTTNLFNLKGEVAAITGGAGLLGTQHAIALLDGGAKTILLDRDENRLKTQVAFLKKSYPGRVWGLVLDITDEKAIVKTSAEIKQKIGNVTILINNAAHNPPPSASNIGRLENFPLSAWNADLAVGLTGAFLMSKLVGSEMAKRKKGIIVNIASDLGVIAPDQRIYRQTGLLKSKQPAKAVTYSVVKHGIIGLTKYLATYFAEDNIRVNSLSPAGVFNGQNPQFVKKLELLVPMGRMAKKDEYRAAILFLCSDASSYMTGANLIIDGGRTAW